MRWKYAKLLDNLDNAIEALCGPEHRLRRGPRSETRRADHRAAEGSAALRAAGIARASARRIAEAPATTFASSRSTARRAGGGSSWQSLSRGTGTIEADFLNGEIVLLGRLHGVPTPVNEALQRLANRAAAEHRAPGFMTPSQVLAAAGVPHA